MAEKKRRSLIDLLTGKGEGSQQSSDEKEIPYKIKNQTQEINDVVKKEGELTENIGSVTEDQEGQLTVDVYKTDDKIIIKSTLAGVKPEDLEIILNNDILTIKGKRELDEDLKNANYYYRELFWGRFSRTIILPVEVDKEKVEASLKNGILTIILPKKFEAREKKIKVKLE